MISINLPLRIGIKMSKHSLAIARGTAFRHRLPSALGLSIASSSVHRSIASGTMKRDTPKAVSFAIVFFELLNFSLFYPQINDH